MCFRKNIPRYLNYVGGRFFSLGNAVCHFLLSGASLKMGLSTQNQVVEKFLWI